MCSSCKTLVYFVVKQKNMENLSQNQQDILFLTQLQDFIDKRKAEMPEGPYTTSLFQKGMRKTQAF